MTLHLRRTCEDDLDFVLNAELDPENRPFIGSWTREEHQQALIDPEFAHLGADDSQAILEILQDTKPELWNDGDAES